MEKIIDYAPTILGLCLAIIGVRKAVLEGWRNIALTELIVGILLCTVNLISICLSSAKNERLQNGISVLIKSRETDSTDNANFRKYLKDTFGIEKRGDTAIVVDKTQYLTVVKHLQPTDTILADSLNYFFRLSKDTLFLSPLQGIWGHGFIAIDTTHYHSSGEIIKDGIGMGSPEPVDKIYAEGKVYNTYLWNIYRAVYKKEPILLYLNDYDKNRYVIFGDEGTSKRYIYKNGKVRWIPE